MYIYIYTYTHTYIHTYTSNRKEFRGGVIGATDPSVAKEGSIRSLIRQSWKDLGLEFEPNTSDNAVHASAGPIEGLKERATWLGVSVEEDAFGKTLLDSGVSQELLRKMMENEVGR